MPYAVIAHYRCEPGDADAVRQALLQLREHTRREPANLAYVVHDDAEDPAAFILYEQYVDRAGFEAHAASEHFAKYNLALVRPKLIERNVLFGTVL